MPAFDHGSVSFRCYPHTELEVSAMAAEYLAQAKAALDSGFDGLMASEHHCGFGGYTPNPLQMMTVALSENQRGWVAPCPLILPLRPTVLLAEQLAWLNAAFPGRVGVGVAVGALESDFQALGVPFDGAVGHFKAELARLSSLLRGEDLGMLQGDKALARCKSSPVPMVSAASSRPAVRRAAEYKIGVLFSGRESIGRLESLCAEYDQAGGTGPKIAVRRVWIGTPKRDLIESQRRVYDSYVPTREGDQTVISNDPGEIAGVLLQSISAGLDGVNLRVHLPGMVPEEVKAQIIMLGEEVLPKVRLGLGR